MEVLVKFSMPSWIADPYNAGMLKLHMDYRRKRDASRQRMCPERYNVTRDLLEASVLYTVAQCPILLFAASPSHFAGPHPLWEG